MDMKSISQKLQDDIRTIMEGNIKHSNQQAIDVHEPEKDEITAHDFKKLRAMKKTPDGKVHNCATHVEHVVLGKGTTVSEQHAEPDTNGNIEWYTVQFENSVQKVLTKDLTITMSEAHMHESEEEQVDEEEKKKVVSPFDYKNYQSQIPKKPGETAGFDSKKISTGTVYSRKPVKEESHQSKTTMKHIPNPSPALKKAAKDIKPGIAGIGDRFKMLDAGGVKREEVEIDEAYQTAKSEFVARQGRLTTAAAETEKDPARLKRMSGIPGYSAAMDLAKKTTRGAKHTKEEFEQLDEIGDTPAGMEKVKAYRAAVGRQTHKTGEYDTRNTDRKLNPFHAKDKAQFPANKTANRIAGAARAKKIETGTRYEEAREYTFAEYLDAARAQYGDEDAVLVANEAFKNQDITLFSDLIEAKVDPITHHQNMYDHHSQHVEIHADGARDAEDGDEEAHHDSAEEEHRDGANAHKEALDAHKNNSPDKKELSSYANAQSKRTKSFYGE